MRKERLYHTTFDKAVKGITMVLCNNIQYVDDRLFGDVREPAMECENGGEYEEEEDEEETDDVYQFYLTDLDEDRAEWYVKHFGLKFAYSGLLDLWVLLVTHFGAPWSGVDWFTDIKELSDER